MRFVLQLRLRLIYRRYDLLLIRRHKVRALWHLNNPMFMGKEDAKLLKMEALQERRTQCEAARYNGHRRHGFGIFRQIEAPLVQTVPKRDFAHEYRPDAVTPVLTEGLRSTDAARTLGLSVKTNSQWIRGARAGLLACVNMHLVRSVTDLQAEVSRL